MIRNTLLCLSFLAVASAANAELLTFVSSSSNSQGLTVSLGNSSLNTQAGPLTVNLDGGANFDAYCVDLLTTISTGQQYNVTNASLPGSSLSNATRVGQIYNAYAGSMMSPEFGAALQLAIWDVVYDDGDGLSVGSFKASGVSAGAATQYSVIIANPLTGISASTRYFQSSNLSGPQGQNLIGGTTPNATPVPEPASMAVLGLGLAALKRRRKNG